MDERERNEEILYFNTKQMHRGNLQQEERRRLQVQEEKDDAAIPFAMTNYPTGGPVIATLVTNREKDLNELCLALRSLVLLRGDSKEYPAPVLVFNEGDLSDEQIQSILRCTDRMISFPRVDFSVFPQGFNFVTEQKFQVKGRSEWGYYQMIRFWLTGIWNHPAIEPYGIVMRIDSDSCFNEENPYLPYFKYDHINYHSQYVGFEDGKQFTDGLVDFAENYLEEQGRVPKNAMLWQFIKTTWEKESTLPLFMTNMEVSRKSLMYRPEIRAWHEALTEKEPFGVFRYRWGDAVVRYVTAAMFLSNSEVMVERAPGYRHKDRCIREDIEKAIASVVAE